MVTFFTGRPTRIPIHERAQLGHKISLREVERGLRARLIRESDKEGGCRSGDGRRGRDARGEETAAPCGRFLNPRHRSVPYQEHSRLRDSRRTTVPRS
jgi:hypothetical protein